MSSREGISLRVVAALIVITATLVLLPAAAMAAIPFDPVAYDVDSPSPRPLFMRVGDFDRDGRPDLVVSARNGDVYVYRNTGAPFSGAWPRTTVATFTAMAPDSMVFLDVGDLDGDGWTDIVAGVSGGAVYALRNDHTPFGVWPAVHVATAALTPRVALADLDGDGRLDLATLDTQYSGDTGWLRVFRNDGNPFAGAWSTSANVGSGYANSGLAAGDLDNDGDVDLAFGANEYYTFAAANDGSPWDSGWVAFMIGSHGFGMSLGYALADFDADGYLDLAMTCPYQPASSQYVLHNDGTPFDGWWDATDYGAAVPLGMVVGDLDLDGDLDFVTGDNCFQPYQLVAWENDGVPFDSNWPRTGVSATPHCPLDVALGDLDGDGDLDVAQTMSATEGEVPLVRVHRNLTIVPEPVIASVADVPGDQGGKVLLEWAASELDNAEVHRIGSYHVWRRLDEGAALQRLSKGGAAFDPTKAGVAGGAIRARQIGTATTYWEYIAEIPARYAEGYAYSVATHADNHVEEFFVDAYEPVLGTWWLSEIASGESIDNLAPATPVAFTATYDAGTTWLQWHPNIEPDLLQYAVYRSPAATGPWTLLATPTGETYGDGGPAAQYYRLTAIDVHGNESGHAELGPSETVDAQPTLHFGLGPIRNPIRSDRLGVEFVLAQVGTARIELLDVTGRRLVSRELAGLGSGRHYVDLSAGKRLAAGLYFVRLTHGRAERVGRVTVVD